MSVSGSFENSASSTWDQVQQEDLTILPYLSEMVML